MSKRNVVSMLWGTAVALVLISGVLLLVLRSVPLGLVSLPPNLVPAVMAFGLWGYIDGEVNLAVSVVGAMTRRPVDRASGYTRQVIWRDTDAYRIQRIDYYDRREELLKTLLVEGYALYEDRYWRPARMHMANLLNGKSTVMNWSDYRFATGLAEQDFTTRALERAR